MNFIFIEAKNSNTSEYNFIKAILDKYFADKDIEIVCMDGVDNLFCPAIINCMKQAQDAGDNVLVLVDADYPSKGWGHNKRFDDIEDRKTKLSLSFPLFIYPNNSDDGNIAFTW